MVKKGKANPVFIIFGICFLIVFLSSIYLLNLWVKSSIDRNEPSAKIFPAEKKLEKRPETAKSNLIEKTQATIEREVKKKAPEDEAVQEKTEIEKEPPLQTKILIMCLAIPAKIIALDTTNDRATVTVDNVQVEVSLALVDDIIIGDYVLVHVGYALNKIDQDEALKTIALFAEAGLSSAP